MTIIILLIIIIFILLFGRHFVINLFIKLAALGYLIFISLIGIAAFLFLFILGFGYMDITVYILSFIGFIYTYGIALKKVNLDSDSVESVDDNKTYQIILFVIITLSLIAIWITISNTIVYFLPESLKNN